MEYRKIQQWLDERGIVLEESFAYALRRLARAYKKTNGMKRLDDVYKLMGASKQDIFWWENHPCSTQTKNF